MPKKEEKKRTFESELLILPALKMILVDSEKEDGRQPAKRAGQKNSSDLKEETVLKIIQKLAKKD